MRHQPKIELLRIPHPNDARQLVHLAASLRLPQRCRQERPEAGEHPVPGLGRQQGHARRRGTAQAARHPAEAPPQVTPPEIAIVTGEQLVTAVA